jgi:hypothetical protein
VALGESVPPEGVALGVGERVDAWEAEGVAESVGEPLLVCVVQAVSEGEAEAVGVAVPPSEAVGGAVTAGEALALPETEALGEGRGEGVEEREKGEGVAAGEDVGRPTLGLAVAVCSATEAEAVAVTFREAVGAALEGVAGTE